MGTQTLIKQPGETRLYSMDFSGLMTPGETISTVNSVVIDADGSDLTLGTPAANGVFAQLTVAGGVDAKRYKFTFNVTTSLGNILEGDGILQVTQL